MKLLFLTLLCVPIFATGMGPNNYVVIGGGCNGCVLRSTRQFHEQYAVVTIADGFENARNHDADLAINFDTSTTIDKRISIGRIGLDMMESLLENHNPELLAIIKKAHALIDSYAASKINLRPNAQIVRISTNLKNKIEKCLGENIFSELEKL